MAGIGPKVRMLDWKIYDQLGYEERVVLQVLTIWWSSQNRLVG